MTEIRRIGVISLAKIVGLIYFVIGLFVFAIFACFMLIGVPFAQSAEEAFGGLAIGLLFVCGLPFLYGLMGFIGGAIIGLVYNFSAGRLGGIEVELVSKSPAGTSAKTGSEF